MLNFNIFRLQDKIFLLNGSHLLCKTDQLSPSLGNGDKVHVLGFAATWGASCGTAVRTEAIAQLTWPGVAFTTAAHG